MEKQTAAKAPQSATAALWSNPVIRTSGSLMIVLGLIILLAAVAKRFGRTGASLAAALGPGGKAPAGLLEVLGRYPLTRGQTLILLKLDSRVLLVAQTTPRIRGGVGTITTLCEVTDPEEVAGILVKAGEHEGESASAKFSALLHKFDKTHAPEPDGETIEVSLRQVREMAGGDRVETWDDRAESDVLHRFPMVQPQAASPLGAPPPLPLSARTGAVVEERPPAVHAQTGTDSFGSIRQRLHALRGEAHR